MCVYKKESRRLGDIAYTGCEGKGTVFGDAFCSVTSRTSDA